MLVQAPSQIQVYVLWFWSLFLWLLPSMSCSQSQFSGQSPSSPVNHPEAPVGDLIPAANAPAPSGIDFGSDRDRPTIGGGADQQSSSITQGDASSQSGLEESEVILSGAIEYGTCAALPNAGKRSYPANCPAHHVVTVINDGTTQEMTCCPLSSRHVLSNLPQEQHIERFGICGPNELATGMVSSRLSTIRCTKINAKHFKIGATTTAIYAKGKKAPSAEMQAIAAVYNISDTCICPVGTVLVGNHTSTDNKCTDSCVSIEVLR